MLREISEDLRAGIKDRLREVRGAIRRRRDDRAPSRGAGAPFPLRGIEGLLGQAASAFDDAMSFAESLVPIARGAKAANGFADYFPAGGDMLAAERLFRRDAYYLTRTVATALKLEDVDLYEAEFAAVHDAIRKRHAQLLAPGFATGDWSAKVARAAAVAAAVTLEMLHHRPIRMREAASADGRATEIGCIAPVPLAMAIATVGADGLAIDQVLESSVLAVEARIDRILSACTGRDPQAELAAVYAALLAHLP